MEGQGPSHPRGTGTDRNAPLLLVRSCRAGTEALAEVQLTGGDTIAVKPLLVDKSLSQLLSDSSDLSYTFPAPIDLNDIQTITLDGTCIYQKDANSAPGGTTSER